MGEVRRTVVWSWDMVPGTEAMNVACVGNVLEGLCEWRSAIYREWSMVPVHHKNTVTMHASLEMCSTHAVLMRNWIKIANRSVRYTVRQLHPGTDVTMTIQH